MRRTRTLAAVAAASVLVVGPLAGLASAGSTTGVGTGTVSATALRVDLGANGDLLSIRVLGDDGTSTIDPAKGTPISSETVRPLTINSKAVPALNLSVPPVSSTSKGAEDKKSVKPALPSSPAFSGSLNALVSSLVDKAGARSGMSAALADLKLAGGLVNVPSGLVQVSSNAATGKATATRSITIPDVRVLDLSAVLDGLGLKLTDLSVDQVLGLLKGLGVTLPGVADPAAAVAALNSAIDAIQAQTGDLTASLCSSVDQLLSPLGGVTGLVGGVLDSLPDTPVDDVVDDLPVIGDDDDGGDGVVDDLLGSVPHLLGAAALPSDFSCSSLTGTVDDLLDTVQGTLGEVLAGGLVQLGSTPLLSVKDVKVALTASATDAVGTSVADVTGSIGSVKVGTLTVPGVSGLDLRAPAATLEQAAATIQGAVGNVLQLVDARLANLVKVDVLDIDKVVGAAGAYTHAASTVTALKATLTPPTGLLGAALIDTSAVPTSTVLGSLTTAVPAIAPLMGQLEASLGGLQALTGTSVISVGELSGDATFRPASAGEAFAGPAAAPTGELPRTGGDAALPAMAAVALGGVALAMRRLVRSAKA
jgi:hypothetical protein